MPTSNSLLDVENIKIKLSRKDPLGADLYLVFDKLEVEYKPKTNTNPKASLAIVYKYSIIRSSADESYSEVVQTIPLTWTDDNKRILKDAQGVPLLDENNDPIMVGEITYWRQTLGDAYILPACFRTLQDRVSLHD